MDINKYLHGWWRRITEKSRSNTFSMPKVENYYFFDIRSRERETYSGSGEMKTLYGFLAIMLVWDGRSERISFTNPNEQYQKYYGSFFDKLEKAEDMPHIMENCIKNIFELEFEKWGKKYNGWKNIL